MAPSGLEQVDGDGFVEFALYGSREEVPALREGSGRLGGVSVEVSSQEVPGDWAERWKRFHVPFLVSDALYVRPPWEEPAVRPGVQEVVIDPGPAFGTGSHPTTRMCLELIAELAPESPYRRRRSAGSFADLGCGSGVLSVAAAKLGFHPVLAVDCDRQAVAATLTNARSNGIELALAERLDLRGDPPPAADIVAANLTRPLLLRVGQLMQRRPRALIVSGVLDREADEVMGAFAPLAERRRLSERGWSAGLLVR